MMDVAYRKALPRVGKSSDEWSTPSQLFDELDRRFRFTLDVAASTDNAKCDRYHTSITDGLASSWAGERVWCNPPFSDLQSWAVKAKAETQQGGCLLAVMLLPANRTGQRWWAELVEPTRDRGRGLSVEFLPGRVHFVRPGSPTGEGERPTFSCCLLIWGDQPSSAAL